MPVDDRDNRIRSRTLAAVEANSGWFVSEYLRAFGTVLNSDNASELFEEYAATRETRARRGRVVRPAAIAVVERVYRDLLAEAVPEGKLSLVLYGILTLMASARSSSKSLKTPTSEAPSPTPSTPAPKVTPDDLKRIDQQSRRIFEKRIKGETPKPR